MPEKTNTTEQAQSKASPAEETAKETASNPEQASPEQKAGPSPWDQQFQGKTPEQVAEEIDHWRKYSREWESRAKASKKELDAMEAKQPDAASAEKRVRQVEQELAQSQSEVAMFRDLIALEVEYGAPVPIATLADSIAFRDAYGALDRGADDFADKLQEIVERRCKSTAGCQSFETGATQQQSSGLALYEQLSKK